MSYFGPEDYFRVNGQEIKVPKGHVRYQKDDYDFNEDKLKDCIILGDWDNLMEVVEVIDRGGNVICKHRWIVKYINPGWVGTKGKDNFRLTPELKGTMQFARCTWKEKEEFQRSPANIRKMHETLSKIVAGLDERGL